MSNGTKDFILLMTNDLGDRHYLTEENPLERGYWSKNPDHATRFTQEDAQNTYLKIIGGARELQGEMSLPNYYVHKGLRLDNNRRVGHGRITVLQVVYQKLEGYDSPLVDAVQSRECATSHLDLMIASSDLSAMVKETLEADGHQLLSDLLNLGTLGIVTHPRLKDEEKLEVLRWIEMAHNDIKLKTRSGWM